MLAKRIIPCLDTKNGRTVKGVNFKGLRDAGCAIELARKYEELLADELVFLDITATIEGRKTFKELVKEISKEISIPFTVGGGISSVKDVDILLENGADKVSINSSAVNNPDLVNELSSEFGSQCIVIAVDSKLEEDGTYKVYINGGSKKTKLNTKEWISECVNRGAGEILLTSINADGTKKGFDLEQLSKMNENLTVPLIASGGAGSILDFEKLFSINVADAGLAASIFHFDEVSIPELKRELKDKNIEVRI